MARRGRLFVVVFARRGQVYLAAWRIRLNGRRRFDVSFSTQPASLLAQISSRRRPLPNPNNIVCLSGGADADEMADLIGARDRCAHKTAHLWDSVWLHIEHWGRPAGSPEAANAGRQHRPTIKTDKTQEFRWAPPTTRMSFVLMKSRRLSSTWSFPARHDDLSPSGRLATRAQVGGPAGDGQVGGGANCEPHAPQVDTSNTRPPIQADLGL